MAGSLPGYSREEGRVDIYIYIYIYIYVSQPVARGHRAYTDLSAARVRGPVLCTVCSLVNWEMTHMQPSDPDPLLTAPNLELDSCPARAHDCSSHVFRFLAYMGCDCEYMNMGYEPTIGAT